LKNIPGLVTLGTGLALNNAIAVLGGLFGKSKIFIRTPKSGSVSGERRKSRYHSGVTCFWWAEILLGVYCLVAFVQYLLVEKWLIGMFLGIYTTGFLVLGWSSRPPVRVGQRSLAHMLDRLRRAAARRRVWSSKVPSR
jgi:hypothetical protein